MKINLYTDLHLEFNPKKITIKSNADVIVLAGDICNLTYLEPLRELLQSVSKPVIYVAGNHEYYNHDRLPMSVLDETVRKYLTNYLPNVHYLCNESVVINNVTFYGGTMWTDLNKSNPNVMEVVNQAMSDYDYIFTEEGRLTPTDTISMHNEFMFGLKNTIYTQTTNKLVVVSHHAPIYKPNPRFGFDNVSYAYFSTEAESIMLDNKIDLWLHGHTHQSYEMMVGDTKVVANAHGYPSYARLPEVAEFCRKVRVQNVN
jgi:predicted phosphodiesterase